MQLAMRSWKLEDMMVVRDVNGGILHATSGIALCITRNFDTYNLVFACQRSKGKMLLQFNWVVIKLKVVVNCNSEVCQSDVHHNKSQTPSRASMAW